MTEIDWSAATFEGSRRALSQAVSGATPQQRMEWLDAALLLALGSGALDRARQQRQAAVVAAWESQRL